MELRPSPIFASLAALLVSLASPSVLAADRLWEAVFALGDPTLSAEAEKTLKDAGPRGIEILLQAARADHDFMILDEPLRVLGCKKSPSFSDVPRTPSIPERAAALVVGHLPAHPELQHRLLSSGREVERALAVLSLLGSSSYEDLERALRKLGPSTHTVRQRLVFSLHSCIRSRKAGLPPELYDSLCSRLDILLHDSFKTSFIVQEGCPAADFAEGLVEGRTAIGSFQKSGKSFFLELARADRKPVRVSAACVLEIYLAARERDRLEPWLLATLVKMADDQDLKRRAAEALIRDLERFEPKKRDRYAEVLLEAGFRVPRAGTSDKQEADSVQAVVDKLLACPSSSTRVGLLGFAARGDALRAADLAWELAERCPEHAGHAAAALIRLGDPRAAQALGKAWDGMKGTAVNPIGSALLERGDTESLAEVARAAQTGHGLALRLQRILEVNGRSAK
ncbi:MAG: hypothetical protein JXR96_17570 [Deltaproteobacteria bacterium]|nr:hypothetical protein [Deltaproteobacteria bacterium]